MTSGAPGRFDAAPAWAPSGRRAVPAILLLVVAANLVAAGTVALLLVGLSAGAQDHGGGRAVIVLTALTYVVLALPAGVLAGLRRQRATATWLLAGRDPTPQEAAQALRLPVDAALLTAVGWLAGALLVGVVGAVVSPFPLVGLRLGLAALLGGVVSAGVTYLLALRTARGVTTRALAAHPPDGAPGLGVRPRLLLTWAVTSGVPLLGLVLLFLDPSNPGGPRRGPVVLLLVAALLLGLLATATTARSVGEPLRGLRRAVQRIGRGDHDVRVRLDDAGEIGLLQEGVNTMAGGLAERERLRDLFGRHVGTPVAARALTAGAALHGEVRPVAALFVDVAGSTALVRRTGPERMVGLLNRFFAVVVDAVEEEGGLVNKFQGDAALCVFGAPAEHPAAAAAALRAARRICAAVRAAGELDVGVGVAAGPVWAGQVGAARRLEYTVIGDAVNEAARLAELAKAVPGRAVASDAAAAAAGEERRAWLPGAVVELRGRGEPTPTWVRRTD
ncbi:adenylate/guanylate cyclase domain-containing protein [Geodermatophilus marinus]|uniref:adenylate/guanylate cyclase domain-containing protein n=1 Tax=Geodermatophilus sp. LHW52908 TaxID=2303986 RepID=UPI0018F2CB4F|nr:adenylate/guanylate cyclase domain-containing protein [Geodermatophilus sp. LHW52908]